MQYKNYQDWVERKKSIDKPKPKERIREIPEKQGLVILLDALGTRRIWKKKRSREKNGTME